MIDINNPLQYCYICKKKSKYVCPKCKIDYCSLACYKSPSHSQCSESFYKKCVLNAHGLEDESQENEKVLIDYYRLFEKELFADAGEEEHIEEDLEARLEDIDLDDSNKVWNALNKKEQAQFEQALTNNEKWLTSLISIWTPWWTSKISTSFLINSDQKLKQLFKHPYKIPTIWTSTEHSMFSWDKISPTLPYNIINVIFGYVYISHLYNGDHLENAINVFQTITKISPVLSPTCNASNIKEAIYLSLECLINDNPNLTDKNEYSFSTLNNFNQTIKDVIDIITGPFPHLVKANNNPNAPKEKTGLVPSKFLLFYMAASLSDLRKLMIKALQDLKKEAQPDSRHQQLPSCVEFNAQNANVVKLPNADPCHQTLMGTLRKSIKKVEFYLCWLQYFQTVDGNKGIVQSWIKELQHESDNIKANLKEHTDTKSLIEQNMVSLRNNLTKTIKNVLIEEI